MYREATELEEKLRHISVALEEALLENMSNPFDILQKVMSREASPSPSSQRQMACHTRRSAEVGWLP